jgi:hypothetical protein
MVSDQELQESFTEIRKWQRHVLLREFGENGRPQAAGGDGVSRTPANVTQADIARTIRAAKQAGAPAVEIKYADGTVIRVPLTDSVETADAPLAPVKEIVL